MRRAAGLPTPEWVGLNLLVIAVPLAPDHPLRMAATTTLAVSQLTPGQVNLAAAWLIRLLFVSFGRLSQRADVTEHLV
jgi:hypothetical protein